MKPIQSELYRLAGVLKDSDDAQIEAVTKFLFRLAVVCLVACLVLS